MKRGYQARLSSIRYIVLFITSSPRPCYLCRSKHEVEHEGESRADQDTDITGTRLRNRAHIPRLVHRWYDDTKGAGEGYHGCSTPWQLPCAVPDVHVVACPGVAAEYEMLRENDQSPNTTPVADDTYRGRAFISANSE